MSKSNGKERKLFSHIRPKSAIAEAFRTLRTNISFSSSNGLNRTILVTSPGPEDGKSTVTSNLGVVITQAKSHVLIIDCDLRKPVMHKYFDLDNRVGLTNLLVQDLALDEAVNATGVEGLHVITSGPIPPNPSELLGSAKMAEILARVSAEYDMVLLDAPPVIAVTDAVLLAPMVDSVLLVLKSGSSRIEMARAARDQLQKANAKSIGVVLNEARMHGDGYYRYYYHYYGAKDTPTEEKQAAGP
ncbi:Tyrosine-protein kinase YwqD [Pelotomaculum sp. FP]|jgi:protein-tyrosine kinase|uniref:CpsD/CapB family tyrosine-protein kinase n=1 Tax=Pelotomaculum sp. FP TaxID=261474 RepID=UPI0010657407|nr:CpsD/CapB family tyrosine-protein kinase [Pelotomaculum sp. FP]TEB13919.1 Tyrosine-protein kinase YwqD [Pelotomaculum sp. FP]